MQKCTLALGCFWKPEEDFKNKPGIIETEVGYAGGKEPKVTYEEVCTGSTDHAEVVRLTFDEDVIKFEKIIDLFKSEYSSVGHFKSLEDAKSTISSSSIGLILPKFIPSDIMKVVLNNDKMPQKSTNPRNS